MSPRGDRETGAPQMGGKTDKFFCADFLHDGGFSLINNRLSLSPFVFLCVSFLSLFVFLSLGLCVCVSLCLLLSPPVSLVVSLPRRLSLLCRVKRLLHVSLHSSRYPLDFVSIRALLSVYIIQVYNTPHALEPLTFAYGDVPVHKEPPKIGRFAMPPQPGRTEGDRETQRTRDKWHARRLTIRDSCSAAAGSCCAGLQAP